ncbi:DUF3305 domain-containing protein [Vibrio breoganii]|uniref:DUF3305 domain-containing protein n=1 Tax=Vibrio breoganii TaxID=553239 RepID=A0AAP8MTE1_9VIBR|nr:DUF3305 domain-containing protein [Vibrio breoganii]PMP07047.1 hypothetical protein BCS94_10285 [Vibrio breoganii]PMP07317.1 hypothetical protein BCS93_16090 [Vibrio breoganii]TKG30351.1 DUF3305 domain-containing protein [Vibrio breoganii]
MKTEDNWPIRCQIILHQTQNSKWQTSNWNIEEIFLDPSKSETGIDAEIQLFKDERTDYRFNLNSQTPKLFVVLENDTESLSLVSVTVSQSVAGSFLDGDYLVLSLDLPLAVQAWMEAYLARHGELIEHKRKKRKGAGRASR